MDRKGPSERGGRIHPRTIAAEIKARADLITPTAMAESGLPEACLVGERGRTTGQLKLFADHIRKGDYLDRRHDEALPDPTSPAFWC